MNVWKQTTIEDRWTTARRSLQWRDASMRKPQHEGGEERPHNHPPHERTVRDNYSRSRTLLARSRSFHRPLGQRPRRLRADCVGGRHRCTVAVGCICGEMADALASSPRTQRWGSPMTQKADIDKDLNNLTMSE